MRNEEYERKARESVIRRQHNEEKKKAQEDQMRREEELQRKAENEFKETVKKYEEHIVNLKAVVMLY